MELSTKNKAVVSNVNWLNKVLWTGSSLALATVLAKIIGGESTTFLGIKFKFEYSWLVFGIYTVAHYYTSILLNRSLDDILKNQSSNENKEIYREITTNGGIFVRGMVPRIQLNKARMSEKDLTAWLSHIAAIILFLAIFPFDKSNVNIISFLSAFGITYLNWIIGSKWAIKISKLA